MSQDETSLITRLVTVVDQQTQKSRLLQAPETSEQLIQYIAELEPLFKQLTAVQKALYPDQFKALEEPDEQSKQQIFDQFTQWLSKYAPNSGIGSTVKIASNLKEGSGVVASRTIQDGELILNIPREVMITTESVNIVPPSQTKILPYQQHIQYFFRTYSIFNKIPSLMLAIYLCFLRIDPNSFFTPYLDALPRTIPCLATSSLQDIKILEPNPTIYQSALRQYKTTLHQYVMLVSILSRNSQTPNVATSRISQKEVIGDSGKPSPTGLPIITFELYRWATSVLLSRQNPIPAAQPVVVPPPKSKKKHAATTRPTYTYQLTGATDLALIPGFDMCNHAAPIQLPADALTDDASLINSYYDDSAHASVTVANPYLTDKETSDGTYASGDQVYIYYGNRTPSQYVLCQGFLPYTSLETQSIASIPQHALITLPLPVTYDEITKIRTSIRVKLGLTATFVNIPLTLDANQQHVRKSDDPSIVNDWETLWRILYVESLNKTDAGALLIQITRAVKDLPQDSAPDTHSGLLRAAVLPSSLASEVHQTCLDAFQSFLNRLGEGYVVEARSEKVTPVQQAFTALVEYEHKLITKQLAEIQKAKQSQ